MSRVLVYAEAYAVKASHGGGFRARIIVEPDSHTNKATHASDRLDTIEKARHWALEKAGEVLGDTPCRSGYYRSSKQCWRRNFWSVP